MLAGRRVLLGVTGGIAAYKSAHLARLLTAAGAEVTVVMTESATRFVGPDTFAALTGRPVHTSLWERPGEVLHVRLAHEADLVVVAPATANLLAKLAAGLADDLLTSTLLEYRGPLVRRAGDAHRHVGAPGHAAATCATLRGRGVRFVGPVTGPLGARRRGHRAHGRARGDRSRKPSCRWRPRVRRSGDLAGRVVVVTAGPTYEAIDPVRFIGNHSSGMMGIAIAAEAARRGADVRLVLGPGTVEPPAGVAVSRVTTADEMRAAVLAQARRRRRRGHGRGGGRLPPEAGRRRPS